MPGSMDQATIILVPKTALVYLKWAGRSNDSSQKRIRSGMPKPLGAILTVWLWRPEPFEFNGFFLYGTLRIARDLAFVGEQVVISFNMDR